MRLAVLFAPAVALTACGDNQGAIYCDPPTTDLPSEGPLVDPYEVDLPDDCLVGGLGQLPGRWFVSHPQRFFAYEYPKYEGTCQDGFRRANWAAEDHDASDGDTFHTWSDGTRFVQRSYARFQDDAGMVFEFARLTATCVRRDGTLGVASLRYTTENGKTAFTGSVGVRFAPKAETTPPLTHVGSLGSWTGPEGPVPIVAYNLVVDGGIAYVAGPLGLDMIDVSDPAQPRHLGHAWGNYNDVKVVRGNGRVVAFLSPNDATEVVDVTNPAQPVALPSLAESSHSVFVRAAGDRMHLYLATYEDTVPIYDVTNPIEPTRIAAPLVAGESDGVHDLFADDEFIYVNYTTAGLVALDVRAPASLQAPVERARFPSTYSHASWAATVNGRRIVIHGDEGMTPDGGAYLTVLDGDPASPSFLRELGRYQSRREVGIHNILIDGDRAYVAYYQDGVRVVDLTDPAHPTEVAHYNTWDEPTAPGGGFEGALGLRHVGDLIYVADSERGLVIVRE